MFDFFYGKQAEEFSFFQVPKVLFRDESFSALDIEAKMLYAILLDRMGLSAEHNWKDKHGRVYIIFTVEELVKTMGCSDRKITKLMRDLEECDLIERKRQGQGKPNIIYVKNFISALNSDQNGESSFAENGPSEDGMSVSDMAPTGVFGEYPGGEPIAELGESTQERKTRDSRISELSVLESPKCRCNKTDISNTDFSDTESFSSSPSSPPPTVIGDGERKGRERTKRAEVSVSQEIYERTRAQIQANLSCNTLVNDYGVSEETLDEIVELVTEIVAIPRTSVRISGFEYPYQTVRDRLLKLNMFHIQYVLDCMSQNTTQVRNAKQYMLTVLFNAPATMGTHTMTQVQHDMCS